MGHDHIYGVKIVQISHGDELRNLEEGETLEYIGRGMFYLWRDGNVIETWKTYDGDNYDKK